MVRTPVPEVLAALMIVCVGVALAAPPAGGGKRVTLEVHASTWRSKRKPYDIRSAITGKLAAAKVTVVKTGPVDGHVVVAYGEDQGDSYSELGEEGDGPKRYGTEIRFSLVLTTDSRDVLSLGVDASPGELVQGDLYSASLGELQRQDQFEFAGYLVAGALGEKSAIPKMLPMLCGDDAALGFKILQGAGYVPTTPAERAYLVIGSGDLPALAESIGKPAVLPLLDCLDRSDVTGQYIDEEAVKALGALRDPRATPWLLRALEGHYFFDNLGMRPEENDEDVPSEVLALISALGDAADSRALAELDSIATRRKRQFPAMAAAAKASATKIRQRAKK